MHRLLAHLLSLRSQAVDLADVPAWWVHHQAASAEWAAPIDRAVVAAYGANCLGFAFASGYQEALRQLIPDLPPGTHALCATEAGGNHPRAIQTRLEPDGAGWRVSGDKAYVTLGEYADTLLVVAGLGVDDAGVHRLALVRVPAARAGVAIAPAPDTPFVPEISHAKVSLDAVRVEPGERLPGDGYAAYLKPFRTVEDCHVHGAVLAYLLRVSRDSGWPDEVSTRLIGALALARSVALAPPASPSVHIALGGLIELTRSIVAELEPHWAGADPAVAATWQRDRVLLGVAGKARARRLEAAWERVRAEAT